jgi:hypothetical protein
MEVMEGSDVVFLGKVISITESTPTAPNGHVPFTGKAVLFDVITLYKGGPKAQYVVHTSRGATGDCGVSFTVGQTAVVFASEWDNQPLRTDSCLYWRPEGAPPDEIALKEGMPPAEQPELTPSSNAPVAEIVTFASVTAMVVFGSIAALIIKRRRKPIA